MYGSSLILQNQGKTFLASPPSGNGSGALLARGEEGILLFFQHRGRLIPEGRSGILFCPDGAVLAINPAGDGLNRGAFDAIDAGFAIIAEIGNPEIKRAAIVLYVSELFAIR